MFKAVAKVQSFIDKEGAPKFFIKLLVDIEDAVKAASAGKDTKK